MILITGATGSVGSAVLSEVLARGGAPRVMYRSAGDAAKAPKGVSTVIADFADKKSLAPALAGVKTVFLVCSPVPDLVALEGNVIDVSKDSGVRHVVLNSALGAGDFQKSFPSWHRQVEEKLLSSGLAYTIVRPNGFFQNIVSYHAATIRAQGAFYAALGDARISLIDVRDVGASAAAILLDPGRHVGKIYELNGPEAVSNSEIAERISRIIGRKVSYVDIPEQAQRKAMLEAGMPDGLVTAVLQLQEYYRTGKCAPIDGALAELLGRAPLTLDQYLRENAASFQNQGAAA
jgi:uncharacterized protein YbjT (DUF2867 family)